MPTPFISPPNNNMDRALFTWVKTAGSSADPLATVLEHDQLVRFCGSVGVNVLFLDIWNYLGGNNWTLSKQTLMKQFLSLAHSYGIRVYALCGNADWGRNLQWVARNILRRLAEFQAIASTLYSTDGCRFDGVLYDVEYWTNPKYIAQDELPGLLNLIHATRMILHLPAGAFTTQWTIHAQDVTYGGRTKKEGQHLLDIADHVVVGAYENNDTTAPGANQIRQFLPWFEYARDNPGSASLWCGSETEFGSPEGYLGKTRSVMEMSHKAISDAFVTPDTLAFRGQAIHAYRAYRTMLP